jgi:hypothetical protein
MRSKISEKGSKGLKKGRFSQKEVLLYQGWEAFPTKNIGIGRHGMLCLYFIYNSVVTENGF